MTELATSIIKSRLSVMELISAITISTATSIIFREVLKDHIRYPADSVADYIRYLTEIATRFIKAAGEITQRYTIIGERLRLRQNALFWLNG